MAITIPLTTITSLLATAFGTAYGAVGVGETRYVFDRDPERAFAQIGKHGTGVEPLVIACWGEADTSENWATKTRVWKLPVDIYLLAAQTDNTDTLPTLTAYADTLIDTLIGYGNRWTGLTDMNHVDFGVIDPHHNYSDSWRDDARWHSVRVPITLRFDYVTT